MPPYVPRTGNLPNNIIEYLRSHPDGASDAELRDEFEKVHQAINQACHRLQQLGIIERVQGERVILNRLLPDWESTLSLSISPSLAETRKAADRSEEWEGSVQERLIDALRQFGWTITASADTALRAPGKDIEATRNSERLWVTVKGYPEDKARTNPRAQARHWFKDAIFDVVVWRGQDAEAAIAVALPNRDVYRTLAGRVAWFQKVARFSFIWVSGDQVEADPAGPLLSPPV